MIRMRTRVSLAAATVVLLVSAAPASAQLEERLSALDAVLPQLYDGLRTLTRERLTLAKRRRALKR